MTEAMAALRRYELDRAAANPFELLSGGQQARFQLLLMEIDSPTMLLLDEPTDNLDVASADALEAGARPLRGHGDRRHARPLVHAADRPVPVLRRRRHGARAARVAVRPGDAVTAAVVLTGAAVRIGGRAIVGPLDLSIGTGEQWVLLGPNGSGKTTALALMGAWRQPSFGAVDVLGERLGRTDVRTVRRRIGHVSHRLAERLPGRRSVLETVCTGREATLVTWWQTFDERDLAEARRLLVSIGCEALADRPLESCSLGERQRVLIARALFGRHELLLFDEPAAGLDLPARERLVEALVTGASSGATGVLATHHLEEIPPTTTHAALLRDGWVIASGAIADVLADGPMTACFDMPIRVERRDERWTARVVR